MNRCYNDVLGYCSGTPDAITSKQLLTIRTFSGRIETREVTATHCRQDIDICGFFLTHKQLQHRYAQKTI